VSDVALGEARTTKVLVIDDSNTIRRSAEIFRNPHFANVPVIMLSSKDGLFDKARGRMVGSEDYLTKPFTKDQLLQAVEQHRVTA
jgi:CheY-like chemotaxis protein